MSTLHYIINVYSNDDVLPAQAESLFKDELADSRRSWPDARQWRFVNLCAADPSDHVLGGLHMDIGPIAFGPLAAERFACVEYLYVSPEHRSQGIATALLNRAANEAAARGCDHIRFNAAWSNPAEIAVCRKAGFAVMSVEDGSYLVVKPTAAVPCHA